MKRLATYRTDYDRAAHKRRKCPYCSESIRVTAYAAHVRACERNLARTRMPWNRFADQEATTTL